MENENDKPALLQLLPYEILLQILDNTSTTETIRFGTTCKQFHEIVHNSPILWKAKLRKMLSKTLFKEIERATVGNCWDNALKQYFNLRSEIHNLIMDMAAHYYKYDNEITLCDIKKFFNKSFSNGLIYYCTINILQELVKKGNKMVSSGTTNPPYTLTEMYYSKISLQHLFHSYLSIRWVQKHVNNDLPPEVVLNFFIQWIDPVNMHTDENLEDAISSLANMVEAELKQIHPEKSQPIQQMCAEKTITIMQIIAAISHVMYKKKRMTAVSVANMDTLDIVKVIDIACGHHVVIAAIYHAIAKRFGVQCELISFPNHLFLELRGADDKQVYKIELETGKLTLKRSCPFSRRSFVQNSYNYCPDSLLQYVVSTFLTPMRSYKTWYMQNAVYLLDFLSTNPNSDNKYKNYLPFLLDHTHLPAMSRPIDVKRLTDEHLKIIALLSYSNNSLGIIRKEITVNIRGSDLKYAVGMIVHHKLYEYLCVVRGWELSCREEMVSRPTMKALQFGRWQPYYIVMAVDQSYRYIAQEHLADVSRPSRLFHLEDIIASEFSHFNGFAYEPNSHKRVEYPQDMAVSDQYRARAFLRFGNRCTETTELNCAS